jgi:hypothetical protein
MKENGYYFHTKLLEVSDGKKNSESLNKRPMKHSLYLLVIRL